MNAEIADQSLEAIPMHGYSGYAIAVDGSKQETIT